MKICSSDGLAIITDMIIPLKTVEDCEKRRDQNRQRYKEPCDVDTPVWQERITQGSPLSSTVLRILRIRCCLGLGHGLAEEEGNDKNWREHYETAEDAVADLLWG